MRRLIFVLIIMAFNFVWVTAEPFELESLRKDILDLKRDLESERRLRIELQSVVHQLQEQDLIATHTNRLDETDILRAELKAHQSIIEQLRTDVHHANYHIQIANNDRTRLQYEINDLKHNDIILTKAFSKEKQNRKQMENEVENLKSKHEDLQLELRKTSDHQMNELMLFKSFTEKSLSTLQSDLHRMETKQNYLNSSASTAKQFMDAYIDGVSNEVCLLYPRYANACQRSGISKHICCLKGALQAIQETLRINGQKQSELELKQNLRISFSAQLSESIGYINPHETIVFSDVLNNEGNAYNPTNGEFVAPVGGTYVFFSRILSGSNKFETMLVINRNIELYSMETPYLLPGSNMLVIAMRRGDSAKMVKHGTWGTWPFQIHHWFSTFTGFLLNVG